MTIYIFGSDSYIARNFYKKTKHKDNCKKVSINPLEGDYYFDLSENSSFDFNLIKEKDIILFFAANSSPDSCQNNYESAYKVNVTGTNYFIEKILERNARVLFFSSDVVFNGGDKIFYENSEHNPVSKYGEMKSTIEKNFNFYKNFKVFRLSYVYSKEDKFSSYLNSCAEKGCEAEVYHPIYRNAIYLDDLIEAIDNLIQEWDKWNNNIFNICGEDLISRVNIAELFKKNISNIKLKITEPNEDFFKARPKKIEMKSNFFPALLKRSPTKIKDAMLKEYNKFKIHNPYIPSCSKKDMVKNLITGIGGFVASYLADLLLEKGEEVVGSYRWNEDLSKIKHCKDKINLIPCDLLDISSFITAIRETKPDYIYHLAAQSYVPDSYSNPIVTIETNTIGTLNLLEAVRIIKAESPGYDPIIYVCSSSEVYGFVKEEDVPISETQLINPGNPYAVGKVGAEMAALVYWTNFGIKTIRTRMFTHTGPRRTMMSAECNFARQIALIEKGKQEPVIYHGNLESIRTWADVRDAVRAYYVLVRKCKPGEVYNIGGNTSKTIGEMLDYLISLSPMKDKIKKIQDPKLMRPFDITLQIPDCNKFLMKTGWQPQFTFEQTMQDLLNWWRENID